MSGKRELQSCPVKGAADERAVNDEHAWHDEHEGHDGHNGKGRGVGGAKPSTK
jgi:hypothetical protein